MMNLYVLRNNTLERFFPKGTRFSGYGDISSIPGDADIYLWFYQAPLHSDAGALALELASYQRQLSVALQSIPQGKTVLAVTAELLWCPQADESDLRAREAVEAYNAFLRGQEKTRASFKVLELSNFTRRYKASELLDWKFWFLSQMGLSPALTADFKRWFERELDSVALKRKKCLVLDLDNTLWGGVLGEEGPEGIKIGGDYPGKAFLFFQEALKELSRSGVILAVCSKNNEADVLEAWEKNPFLVLRKDDFAARRINWNNKADNIREIASELNIGLDSLVFVDDNPSEREAVRQLLPDVQVPEFPEQPYSLPEFYARLVEDYFKVYKITDEDRGKTEQYKANAARSEEQKRFGSLEDFIRSLDIHLSIKEADAYSIPRIAQMTQKTNQFNLTTERLTDSEVSSLLQDGARIFTLSVRDRFGDSGISAALMVCDGRIRNLLVSCRVLGKGIEKAFVKTVLGILRDEGLGTLKAGYLASPKNSQTRDFYESCGFVCTLDTQELKDYEIDLSKADSAAEDCYTIEYEGKNI